MTTSSLPRPALRDTQRAWRRAVPPPARIAAAEAVAQRLLALPHAPATGHVAGYWAMDGEIALHAWQVRLPESVTYCLPVLSPGRVLRFGPWRPGQPLRTNRYGIPEPDVDESALMAAGAMAMVVAPLLAFDDRCQRLGMGGGWYDRSFAFRRAAAPPPLLVGAGFDGQRVDRLHEQPWDVPLDAVCTERSTWLPPGDRP